MKCDVISYMVLDVNASFGMGKAVTQCKTHNWLFDGPATELCPIGRIEQATEEAIARIKAVAVSENKG